MNINELSNYSIDDAVKFNSELNPALWDGQRLRPEVRAALMQVAEDFQEFLGISSLAVSDITLSGSNAGYTYTSHSDIDLHIVADIPQLDNSEVFRELFSAKKNQYNADYDIKIRDHDVELYVQNPADKVVSQGIYSVLRDDWISIPKQRAADVDELSTRAKIDTISSWADSALSAGSSEAIECVLERIYTLRRAGLEHGGELSPENLAFKTLRANGVLDRLRRARNAARGSELSLEAAGDDKTPAEYGWVGEAAEVLDVPTPTVEQIAARHQTTVAAINAALKRGIKVEQEHTTDLRVAREIALDHLAERPDYYTRLATVESTGPSAVAAGFRSQAKQQWPDVVIDLYAGHGNSLLIGKIEVPKHKRKLGIATDIMKSIAGLADQHGLRVMLTPSNEFGASKARLIEFYKRFGFVVNRGRAKDFEVSELMYRDPRPALAEGVGRITPQNQTVDVGPNEIRTQAAKFGNRVSRDGYPENVWKPSTTVKPLWLECQVYRPDGSVDISASLDRANSVITETVEPVSDDAVKYLNELKDYTAAEVGQPHIAVLISSTSAKPFQLMMPVGVMTLEGIIHDGDIEVFKLAQNGQVFKYPTGEAKYVGWYGGFLFRSVTSYNLFRTAVALRFTVELPEQTLREATSLAREWARFKQNPIAESLEALDEVNMAPGRLAQWASSNTSNITVGFEAELVFRRRGASEDDGGEYNYEPDRDTYSLEDIHKFFTEREYQGSLSGSQGNIEVIPMSEIDKRDLETAIKRLQTYWDYWLTQATAGDYESLVEPFVEYMVDQHYASQQKELMVNVMSSDGLDQREIREVLADPRSDDFYRYNQLAKRHYSRQIENNINDNSEFDEFVQQATEEARANFDETAEWEEFAKEYSCSTMREFAEGNYIDWPWAYPPQGPAVEYSAVAARQLGLELEQALDVEVKISSSYHGEVKDATSWYIEPDSSIEPNPDADEALPVEIVSPPMPFQEGVAAMGRFFDWVKSAGGYSNSSTGFHMSMSFDNKNIADLDYLKLVLFLGDRYILQQFGRLGNRFCSNILSRVAQPGSLYAQDADIALDKLRQGLTTVASQAIIEKNPSKYFSINVKPSYVEFRGIGNEYVRRSSELVDMANRYARAMSIAFDPTAYVDEYAKKLYKTISAIMGPEHNDAVQLFVNYAKEQQRSPAAAKANLKQAIKMFRRASPSSGTAYAKRAIYTIAEQLLKHNLPYSDEARGLQLTLNKTTLLSTAKQLVSQYVPIIFKDAPPGTAEQVINAINNQ